MWFYLELKNKIK